MSVADVFSCLVLLSRLSLLTTILAQMAVQVAKERTVPLGSQITVMSKSVFNSVKGTTWVYVGGTTEVSLGAFMYAV